MIALDIETLSLPERLDLLARLWDSLDDAAVPVPLAQRVDLERRLKTADADLAHSVAWESMRADATIDDDVSQGNAHAAPHEVI